MAVCKEGASKLYWFFFFIYTVVLSNFQNYLSLLNFPEFLGSECFKTCLQRTCPYAPGWVLGRSPSYQIHVAHPHFLILGPLLYIRKQPFSYNLIILIFLTLFIAWNVSKCIDFSSPFFPVFGMNTEIWSFFWSVFFCVQTR